MPVRTGVNSHRDFVQSTVCKVIRRPIAAAPPLSVPRPRMTVSSFEPIENRRGWAHL
jgi:hypothetical protein